MQYYNSVDRSGKNSGFGLLPLSIDIVATEAHPIASIAEISSIASDLKNKPRRFRASVILGARRGLKSSQNSRQAAQLVH